MSPLSAAEKKAAERVRKRKAGFKPREVWVKDEDWPRVQRYLERVNGKYAINQTGKQS